MTAPLAPIKFHLIKSFNLSQRRKLKASLRYLMDKEERSFSSLDYIFCSDEYLLKINQDFLKHDDLTDIITFDLSEPAEPTRGEIYVSIDRVRENASQFKVSFQKELHRVLIHGALHLCGYKDKTKPQKQEMRRKEDYYMHRSSI